MTRKARKVKNSHKKQLIILITCILLLIPFCYWQNNAIVVTDYVYSSPKITEALDGYRIVQISDLHNKRFGKNQKRLLEKIRQCGADCIVLTGDLVDSNRFDPAPARELVREAVQIAPVYYVTGNHELWLSEKNLADLFLMLEEEGVVILEDEKELLQTAGEGIELLGLDDGSMRGTALKEMAQGEPDQLRILLAHEPQYFEKYCAEAVDLVLTGHAHGGQVRLPFIGGLVAPDQGLFPQYTEGAFEKNGTTMLVSRGLGNSIVPLRLFNYPEILCVTLQKQ